LSFINKILILKKIVLYILGILSLLFRPFIKKNIIILQTYSPNRYAGSPRYLFEYLSKNTDYIVYWVTNNKEIKKHIDSMGMAYLPDNIALKLYITLKVKIVIDSGTGYYNWLNLVGKDVIKICTLHGSGPKMSLWRTEDLDQQIKTLKIYHNFNYVGFSTKYAQIIIGKGEFLLPSKKMILRGTPKDDILFDSSYLLRRRREKPILNSLGITHESKCIFYAPTYRPYTYPEPITGISNFDYEELLEFLELYDIYIVYSHHSLSLYDGLLKEADRIKYIDNERWPLLDNNQLLIEVDMMLGDYSTLTTNFSILKMPQLFLVNDYEKYRSVRGVAEDMEPYFVGPKIKTMYELTHFINKYINNENQYRIDYSKGLDKLKNNYVGSVTKSCERYTNLIHTIFKNK
jgi:CDP-glycerol glycerophosphotransferase (TagB/SpsB family)